MEYVSKQDVDVAALKREVLNYLGSSSSAYTLPCRGYL